MPAAAQKSSKDEEVDADKGTTPDEVKRHHTDSLFCLFFLAVVGSQAYVLSYAFQNGNPGKFMHMPTAKGDFCGMTSSVVEKPYLLFCMDGKSLSYADSVCVGHCGEAACGGGGVPYKAEPFGGMVCLPDKESSKKLASESMALLTDNPNVARLLSFRGIMNAWPLLAASAAASIVFGYLFLFLVEKFAGCLIWLGFGVLVLGTGGLGGCFIYSSTLPDGLDGLPSTGDSQKDLYIGGASASVSFVALLILLCKRKSVNQAIKCIESAADCIEEAPALLFEPLWALTAKLLSIIVSLVGMAYLLSTGDGISYDPDQGIQFEYTDMQKGFIVSFVIFALWGFELCNAFSTFAIAYTTQLWFFQKSTIFAVPKAYGKAAWYHLGSLALGSLIIALTRGVRIALSWITKSMHDSGNPVGAALACVMHCFVACFEKFLQCLNKFAYMDIAINSNGFCTAARHALSVMLGDATTVLTMEGATFMFEIAGGGSITAFGAAVTYFASTELEMFKDPSQEMFVEDPISLTVVSGVICFFLSLPFMLVFSNVADTILFCFALERRRTPEEDEKKSFIKHMTACWVSAPPGKSAKPEYDSSRHPGRTRALLSKVSDKK